MSTDTIEAKSQPLVWTKCISKAPKEAIVAHGPSAVLRHGRDTLSHHLGG